MKINWGTGIIIAFALFISFILYFVFTVQSDSKYDNEMVIEEYYKVDSRYGEEMKKQQNAIDLPSRPEISKSAAGVVLTVPPEFASDKFIGNLAFYRPSNKKLDFELAVKLIDGKMIVSKEELVAGVWKVTLSWQHETTKYSTTEKLYLD